MDRYKGYIRIEDNWFREDNHRKRIVVVSESVWQPEYWERLRTKKGPLSNRIDHCIEWLDKVEKEDNNNNN